MRLAQPNIKVDIGLSYEATPLPLTKSLPLGNDFYFLAAYYGRTAQRLASIHSHAWHKTINHAQHANFDNGLSAIRGELDLNHCSS